jgi:predicted anti-sigma-YlaC factor YlaD
MREALRQNEHLAEATLWQWREQELEAAAGLAVEQHLQNCAACRKRAQSVERVLREMRAQHHAPQPSLAQQMHLLAALQSEFAPTQKLHALAETCHSLVRWLAPAFAILAAVFVLGREETATANGASLEGLLSQSREEQLLMASDEEAARRALMELAFAAEER